MRDSAGELVLRPIKNYQVPKSRIRKPARRSTEIWSDRGGISRGKLRTGTTMYRNTADPARRRDDELRRGDRRCAAVRRAGRSASARVLRRAMLDGERAVRLVAGVVGDDEPVFF